MNNPSEIPIKLPKQKIAFLMKIIEGYGHLGVLTTIDPKEGLAVVRVTPDTAGEMCELLAQFSFVISTKSSSFGAGYSSSDITDAFAASVKREIAKNQQNGFPVARYDKDKKKAYLEHDDGSMEYVNG